MLLLKSSHRLSPMVVLSLVFIIITTTTAVPVDANSDSAAQVEENLRATRYNSPTPLWPSNMTRTPMNVFNMILNVQPNPDPDLIKELVAFDATYVSLTFDNPDLHAILPWAGTRARVGPQAFIDTFSRVGLWWQRGPFEVHAMFGDGGNVTAWGEFEITSNTMGRSIRAPWSSRAEINDEGKITYFQYMEDTFGTTSTFWADGKKEFRANPFGGSQWF